MKTQAVRIGIEDEHVCLVIQVDGTEYVLRMPPEDAASIGADIVKAAGMVQLSKDLLASSATERVLQ